MFLRQRLAIDVANRLNRPRGSPNGNGATQLPAGPRAPSITSPARSLRPAGVVVASSARDCPNSFPDNGPETKPRVIVRVRPVGGTAARHRNRPCRRSTTQSAWSSHPTNPSGKRRTSPKPETVRQTPETAAALTIHTRADARSTAVARQPFRNRATNRGIRADEP